MEEPQPTSIGKYEILSVIGRGGMGVVYRAQDPLMGRQVAIKTVTEGFSRDAYTRFRLNFGATVKGIGHHPNIATVYEVGEQNGLPYIVMEYVEGDPLDALIQGKRPLTLIDKLDIIRQVCDALGHAHRNCFFHGNVRPSNVIVRKGGNVQLQDFGLSPLLFPRLLSGFQPYIAPEGLRGGACDGRSDIFAVGVVFFHLLTGSFPFRGPDYIFILFSGKRLPLSDFLRDYPAALDDVLDRSLAIDPAERYQSADEMAADLGTLSETMKHEATAQ
jgi:serine/threonine-protein kinase